MLNDADHNRRGLTLSRRRFLRLSAIGATSLSLGGLLLGCGSSDSSSTSTSAATAGASTGSTAVPSGSNSTASPATSSGATPGTSSSSTAASSTAASANLPGKDLTIRNRGEIVNLDPHLGSGNPDAVVDTNIYSKLVITYPDARDKLVPDLATDWTISPDATEFVFHLRKGAQWHRGYGEVTAQDVVWTFTRVQDPKLGSRSTASFAGLASVVADDPYTVRIKLKAPDPTFPFSVLAEVGYIGSQKAIEEKAKDYSSQPIGSGPYVFDSWTKGEQCVLVKNPDHWLHQGNLDKVTFKFLLDDTVVELSLRSGDLDMAYVETPESQTAVMDNKDLTSINQPAARVHLLWFREKEGTPTADPRVRQALAIAINRDLLAQEALSGMAQPAYSVFNPTLPGYVDTNFFPFDTAKAKQLLSDAGFPDGIKLDFIGYSDGVSPDIISVVQSQWKDVGVDAKVTILERALLYKRWQDGDFEVLEQPVARDIPEQMIFPYFTAAGFPWPNEAHYEGIKDLAAALQPEPDITKRVELYKQIQQKIAEDTPVIPTVYPKVVLGMRKGIDPFPVDIWYYPLWRMKVTK